jgi:sarcosine oxidase
VSTATADVVVVGLGVMGSATVDALARAGHSVVGVEAGSRGHQNGSSHGPTRIIRRSIEEGPMYVPIVLDALERWDELEADAGRPIIDRCGVIRIAPMGSPLHDAFRQSAHAWGLPYETLDAARVMERFPGFAVPARYEGLFEDGAGLLYAAAAVRAFQTRAERHRAVLRFDEPVVAWTAGIEGVTVTTTAGTIVADRLVLTAGAWTRSLAAGLRLPLVAHRVVNASFTPLVPDRFDPSHCPAFIIADDVTGVYGVPAVAGQGVKLGTGGTPTHPDAVDRHVTEADVAPLRAAVDRFLPRASGPIASTLTCLYTVAPDGHFVIDRHPEHAQVVVASPCSGHGFKFASAIGPLLAGMATGRPAPYPIDAFRVDRFTTGRSDAPPALDVAGGRAGPSTTPS